MTDYKRLNIRIPTRLWEEFYRLYPERGRRTKFVLDAISREIEDKRNTKEIIRNAKNG